MIGAGVWSGPVWTAWLAAAVFLTALIVLAVDRMRMKRRLARAERSAALLRTDLADAQREVASLRDVVQGRRHPLPSDRSNPGDPAAPVR